MSILRKIFGLGPKINPHELILNGAILIDVRTPGEFAQGKPKGAKNIPLNKINKHIQKNSKIKQTSCIMLCLRNEK